MESPPSLHSILKGVGISPQAEGQMHLLQVVKLMALTKFLRASSEDSARAAREKRVFFHFLSVFLGQKKSVNVFVTTEKVFSKSLIEVQELGK